MPTLTPDAALPRRRNRLPRLAAILLICVAALGLVLPLAARQAIGPTRLKELTVQALSDALGRQVTVSGDVSITMRPWLGLSMGPVTVANAPGFGDGPMLTAGRLDMTIRMLPLLVKVVSPGSVRVSDLVVDLARNADGRANWDDLTALRNSAAGSGWTVAPQPRDIRLENLAARYQDAATGRTLAVTGARLRTGLGQPFDFSASFTAAGMIPDTALECHLQGWASFDAATGRFGLHGTKVETGLVVTAPLLPGGATPARLVSRFFLDYDPTEAVLTVSDIDARTPGLRLTGKATATGLPGAPRLRTELALTADMAGNWLDILGLTRPDTPQSLVAPPDVAPPHPTGVPEAASLRGAPPPPGQATAAVTVTADAAGVTLERLDIRLPRGTIRGTARATLGDAPTFDAAVTAEDVPFDSLPRPVASGGWPVPGAWLFARAIDVRAVLTRCSLGNLAIADAAATLRGSGGLVRLYPASAVLPDGGVLSLDARLTASGGPDGGPGCAIVAGLEPVGTKLNFTGRLDSTGAAGVWSLTSPDPAGAAKALRLAAPALPSSLPLEAKGQVTWLPGQPGKCAVTGLDAKIAGAVLRGQFGYGTLLPAGLSFDLAADSLDQDRLSLPPPTAGPAVGNDALP
ncbi:MAG: AsmA family protein, partial [Acidobacteriota bacterium]